MKRAEKVELATKVILTFVAVIGVWQYFDDRADTTRREARQQALSTIALSTGADMLNARRQLHAYWASEPEFISFVAKAEAMGPNAYPNFVRMTLPRSDLRDELFDALSLISQVYATAFFCRKSEVCDVALLDDYYCKRSIEYAKLYEPHFDAFNQDVAGSELGAALRDYSEAC